MKVKPKLRGVQDVVATLLAAPGVYYLTQNAKTPTAALCALVYGISLVFLFAASALYHTPMWSPRLRTWFRRVDHSAIYILIAGSYTPLCGLVLGSGTTWLLWLVWVGAALGFIKSFFWTHAPRFFNVIVYMIMGWSIFMYIPALYDMLDTSTFMLFSTGGVLYTLGGFIFIKRWPNPNPAVFGYHELFHSFIVIAGACHYKMIWDVVTRFG